MNKKTLINFIRRIPVSKLIVIALIIVAIVLVLRYFFYYPVVIEPITVNNEIKQYKAKRNKKEYIVDQEDVRYYGGNEGNEGTDDIQLVEHQVEDYVIRDFLENRDVIVDTQNVHDTSIQNNLKKKYETYSMTAKGYEDVEQEIMRMTKDKDVHKALKRIYNRNSTLTNFEGETESAILEKTWRAGNLLVKEQIIKELKDCLSTEGVLYCPTGVASRIVSASYIENPENFPKDRASLNTEILMKCSLIKQENPDISKQDLTELIIDDYAGIYDKEFITTTLQPWIDHV